MCTGANSAAGPTPNPRPMTGNSGAWGNGSGPAMGPGSPGWNNANNNQWFNGGGWQDAYAQAGIGQGGGPRMQAFHQQQAQQRTDAGAPVSPGVMPVQQFAPGGVNMPPQNPGIGQPPPLMATIGQGGSMGYGAPQPMPAFAPGGNGGLLGTGGIKPDRIYQPTPGPWTNRGYSNAGFPR